MKVENLEGLEFPRLMHGPDGTKRRVEDVEGAEQAQKDGYTLHPELTDEQKKAVDKVNTPEQVKANAAAEKAKEAAAAAELAAQDAQAKANAPHPESATKKK